MIRCKKNEEVSGWPVNIPNHHNPIMFEL